MQRSNTNRPDEKVQNAQTGRIIPIEGETTDDHWTAAVTDLKRLISPQEDCPVAALKSLFYAACLDTGGSQAARNFLFWLAGRSDPTGYEGNGGIELRRLDRELKEASLDVLRWWSGPTASDEPLYEVLRELRARFEPTPADKASKGAKHGC
jgi:hypothetical protein